MPRHEAIVDWEILNPGRTQRECADELGLNEGSISVIRNSDAFIDYRYRRLGEHHAAVSESVIDKVENVAKLSLDIIEERFEVERKVVPLGGVKDTAEMALKALGFGQPRPSATAPGGATNLTIVVGADPILLAQAREKMRVVNETPRLEEPTPEPVTS